MVLLGLLLVLLKGPQPVLGAPPGRVRRVYRNNPQPCLVGHRGQPVPELRGRQALYCSLKCTRLATVCSPEPGAPPSASVPSRQLWASTRVGLPHSSPSHWLVCCSRCAQVIPGPDAVANTGRSTVA